MAGGKKTPSSQYKELTPEEYDECERIIRANPGISRNEVARRMGRSAYSVTKMAHSRGLTFDRTKTRAATEAMVADAAARRAALAEALLNDAERLRRELFSPTLAFNFGGKDNTYEEREIPQPTPADQLKIVQAVATAAKSHLELVKYDQGDEADTAKSILAGLARQFGLTDGD